MNLPPLPIDQVLPQLIAALGDHNAAVLKAPTGAGKTSRVPPAILDAGLAGQGQVLLLQPRRLAARAAAWRIAEERGVPVGGEVGYHVRFDRKASRATRILVLTEGMFLRLLQDDPFLERVGAVIFDEFHERSLDADLSLAIARRLQQEVRADLKLVVMSATLAIEPIAQFLGDCPRIESAGRLHPVSVEYRAFDTRAPIHVGAGEGVRQILTQTAGEVLVFLPGVGEIRRTADELAPLAAEQNLAVMQLYGDLPLDQQQAVLRPADRRKIVLSTNVAETSVTIEGITGVVDSGLARVLRFDPSVGLNRLEVERISRASAAQRTGRAGRTAPGVCLRLWTEAAQRGLAEHDTPEIARVDLAGAVLQLLTWGENDVKNFGWFEPPPPESLDHALALLRQLGAIGERGVTDLGARMSRLPAQPRIARLLCEGQRLGHPQRAALAGALLSERDPLVRSGDWRSGRGAKHWSNSDVLDRVLLLEEFERGGRKRASALGLDAAAATFIFRARDQLLRALEESSISRQPWGRFSNLPVTTGPSTDSPTTGSSADTSARQPQSHGRLGNLPHDEALLRALLAAFPDRLARRRDTTGRRAVMVGGRGVRLADESAVRESPLFVCVDVEEIGKSESLVRQASAVERAWLDEAQITTAVDVEFDPERGRVIGLRRTRFADLVLDEAATNVPADFDAGPILAQAAAERFDPNFCQDEAGLKYLARLRSLARWMPELELPDLGDDPLRGLLSEICHHRRSLDEVRRAPLTPILQSRLTPRQIQAIAREAPERLAVPSGSQIALEYEPGQPPRLSVRIQEIFGLRQTPRVAGGRVPVVMELLAPNMRPQQVTTDLESFWRTTYAEVRKDLRRRYPKHAWPEDPLTAPPQRRPGKKPG